MTMTNNGEQALSIKTGSKCGECFRWFDLWEPEEAGEWYYGHDCTPPEKK